MPLEILLISQNLKLADKLEKQLAAFQINTRISFEPLDHLLQQVSGIVWDLTTTKLPVNDSELAILRSQIAGPILLLDKRPRSVETVRSYFLDYHLDDYICGEPTSEIVARIVQKIWVYQNKDNLQLTQQSQESESLVVGHLKIDLSKFEVNNGHKKLNLSPIEYKLLLFFVSNSNTVLSRTQIASAVWGNTTGATLRIIDTHISNLRKKIEIEPKNPQMLTTIRGFGYLFKNKGTQKSQVH